MPGTFKRAIEADASPHASGMLKAGNWMYRLVFPHFFKKMRYDLPADADLATYAQEGTLVYVGMRIHNLEYAYFGHLFNELNMPLAVYANGISLRRWMLWPELSATVVAQFESMAKYGGIPHPASTGELTKMLVNRQSIFLTLAQSELTHQTPHASESHQLIESVIRAQKESDKPIYIVPINFVWDRRPQKTERSIIDILFGEKDNPGAIRKTFLFWRNYKSRAVVRIEAPIDLKAFAMERPEASDDELADHIRDRLVDSLAAKRRVITGPPIRPQRWFVDRVMEDPVLEKRLDEIAVEFRKPVERIRTLAKRNAHEIAASLNYTYIDILKRLMNWVFKNLFESISVDTATLNRIKDLSAYAPLTFVPSHKSHVDYLLLSYIFDRNNMIVPHIAAGANLSFWPLGPFFRRCGAYFIRRTFRRNPVYRDVLTSYIAVLAREGYNQEFFIEGGRSRTGRLRPARLGMLSMMADSVINGSLEDFVYVPVAVTYDRVIEHRSYTHELEGGEKQPERTRDIAGLTKFLKRQKEKGGTIYVRFGTPVSIQAAAHECGVEGNLKRDDKAKVVRTLGDMISHEINAQAVITPLAVAAMALLLKPKRAVAEEDFKKRVQLYLDFLATRNVEISESLKIDHNLAMGEAVSYLERANIIVFHDDPEYPFYEVMENKRLALDYYKNTALHFMASISILCTVLKKRSSKHFIIDDILPACEFMQNLFQMEFHFNKRVPVAKRLEPALNFLIERGALLQAKDGSYEVTSNADELLDSFTGLITSVTDAYIAAIVVLSRYSGGKHSERTLTKAMMEMGPNLFLLGKLSHREALTRDNFVQALAAFRTNGAISQKGQDRRSTTITVDVKRIKELQEQLEEVI